MSKKSLCVLVSFLLVSPSVTAEIFKCEREKGKIIYQNFRCELDSIGSSATASPQQPAPASPNTSAPSAQSANTPLQAGTHNTDGEVVTVFGQATPGAKLEPKVGMTARQVRRLSWGEPANILYSESSDGRIQTWLYDGKRIIRFGSNGRVAAVEQ